MYSRAWNRLILAPLLMFLSGVISLAQGPVTFEYFYDELGQLTKVVDSTGVVIEYVYDPAGNVLQINRSTLSSPGALAIFNFIPSQGIEGATVTIQGQAFDPTPANDTVKFKGTPARVTSATATSLVVSVPKGAASGPISVTVGSVTAQSSASFAVLPHLVSLAVTPANPAIPLGSTFQFTATGTFSDGTTQDLTTSVTWSSSNTAVATISNLFGSQGQAKALAIGNAVITAASGSITGSTGVVVAAAVLASISVTPVNTTLAVGKTLQFTATGTLTDGTTQDITTTVTWASSNTAMATISNSVGSQGLVSAIAVGTTTISATSGSIVGSTTLTVVAPVTTGSVPRFVYEVASSSSAIGRYTVDAATGQLRPNGFTVALPSTSNGVLVSAATDPAGKFIYAADATNKSVWGFTIDSATGALTPIPGSPFTIGAQPFGGVPFLSITVDPLGKFLYVADDGDAIVAGFAIDATTGALTAVPGSPFLTGTLVPESVVVDTAGRFVYLLNSDGSISAYAIDATSGVLTLVPGSPFPSPGRGERNGLAVDPLGGFLYANSLQSGNLLGLGVVSFSINSTTGALTAVSGSPFLTAGNPAPISVTVDPSGRFVYVGSSPCSGCATVPSTIFGFSINQKSGALTPITGSPFFATANGMAPVLVADPSGKFLYTAASDMAGVNSEILPFGIDSTTGALTALGNVQGQPTSGNGTGLVITSGSSAVKYTPTFAYVANGGNNNVSAYTIDPATGALTAVAGSPSAAGTTPISVTTDLAGRFAYVANSGSNNVSGYTINLSTGALSQITGSPFAAGTGPSSVAVDSSGSFALVTNKASNTVSAYSIGANGALTLTCPLCTPTATGMAPSSVTVDPTGQLNYETNFADNTVGGGETPGFLDSTTATGTGPSSVVVDPSGNFAYVANSGSNTVSAFTLNHDNQALLPGVLIPTSASPFAAGNGPVSVAVDPFGKFLYAANQTSNDVSAFTINRTTGNLTTIAGSPFLAGGSPSSATVDISGKYLYVTNSSSNNVSVFSIDPNTGALSPAAGSPFPSGSKPSSVTTTGKIQ